MQTCSPIISRASRNPSCRALISLASSAFRSLTASAASLSASRSARYVRALSGRSGMQVSLLPYSPVEDWSADLQTSILLFGVRVARVSRHRPQGMVGAPALQAIPGFKLLGDRGRYLAVGANR